MARRQHHNSVSLFPFLAVLVCAMGSLILLLLVMTRKIRNDQLSETASQSLAAVAPVVDRSGERRALETRIATLQAEVTSAEQNLAAIEGTLLDGRTRIRELSEIVKQLGSSVSTVTTADLSRTVDESRSDIATLEAQAIELRAQLTEQESVLLRKRELLAQAQQSADTAKRVLHERNSALISLRARIEDAQSQSPAEVGTSTLVEFSNPSGTTRTPIVVDVTARGYELLPNGPVISPNDMEGFPIRDNPLLASILAAHEHRTQDSVVDAPYVLLLVRPDGCLPFYSAQRILTEAHVHHGYELLVEDRRIVTGAVDAAERVIVDAAISDAMKRREQLYSKLLELAQSVHGNGEHNSGAGSSDSGAPTRQLAIRPDGRVVTEEGSSAQQLPGRFYAGGVAPSNAHLRHRPPGGYGQVKSRLSDAEAEQLADEFAERYARQREAGGAGGSLVAIGEEPPVEAGRLPVQGETEQSPAHGGRAPQATFPRQQPADAGRSQGHDFVPMSPEEAFLAQSIGPVPRSSATGSGRLSDVGIAGRSSQREQESGGSSPDLSRIDPDLLARLQPSKKPSNSLSTPVGIVVFLDQQHLTVGQQQAVELNSDRMTSALATLLTGINYEVEDARRDPSEPLMPIVKFIVSPGGERWRLPLARELRGLGIHSATVYELTPYITVIDNAGRARLPEDEL